MWLLNFIRRCWYTNSGWDTVIVWKLRGEGEENRDQRVGTGIELLFFFFFTYNIVEIEVNFFLSSFSQRFKLKCFHISKERTNKLGYIKETELVLCLKMSQFHWIPQEFYKLSI